MAIKLEFEIMLKSDYHVGAGHGDGLVDTLLLRDGDGIPVIRGSTITGLLRDGVYQLLQHIPRSDILCQASGLPEEDAAGQETPRFCGQFSIRQGRVCPVCRVFGSPAHPKQWRFSGARPVESATPGAPGQNKAVGGNVVQRARISPRSRRAEAHKLFSQEQGESGWQFAFTVWTDADGAAALEEAALLVAAARAVRGFGQARRRGRGECRIHLKDRASEQRWLSCFQQHWLEGKAVTDWPVIGVDNDDESRALPNLTHKGDVLPKRVRILARADEPILIAGHSEAGNEFESTNLIPGSAILGALANRAAQRFDLNDNAARQAFVQLFLRGRVRFSALLPAYYNRDDEELIPVIPAPLDLLTCKAFPGFQEKGEEQSFQGKREEHTIQGYALSSQPPAHCPDCESLHGDKDVPLKPFSAFITINQDPLEYKPQRRYEMHIAVDPRSGRVHEQDLYGYVSLEAGQYFIGELLCTDDTAWQALRQMADLPDADAKTAFTLRVGRAAQRGHGKLSIVLCNSEDMGAPDPWRGLPLRERVTSEHAPCMLEMTLLTDTIVPAVWCNNAAQSEEHQAGGSLPEGGWKNASVGFSEEWLSLLLGTPVEIVRAFARPSQVDGFFGHLGVPRFRDMALRAGSAVGLRLADEPSGGLLEKLHKLEQEGIGLRREEGYGQVVFNHPLYVKENFTKLQTNVLTLPEVLTPSATLPAAPVVDLAKFRLDWEKALNAKSLENLWKREGYDDVARLVLHGAGQPIATLKKRLLDGEEGTFGQPNPLLERDLGSPRAEKKHVKETREGRQKIVALLDDLEHQVARHADERLRKQLTRTGIEMLADRVGQDAARARQERQKQKTAPQKEEEVQ